MSDLALPAAKPTARQHIATSKELAAALLPVLVERLGVQTMLVDDPEVTGKAIDRLAKLAGATDDKTTNLPVIHFNISSSGAKVAVKSKAGAASQTVELETPSEPFTINMSEPAEPEAWASGLFGAVDE